MVDGMVSPPQFTLALTRAAHGFRFRLTLGLMLKDADHLALPSTAPWVWMKVIHERRIEVSGHPTLRVRTSGCQSWAEAETMQ